MEIKEILICDCHSTEHQMIVMYDSDESYPIVYVHTHLSKRPFWERIKYAVKYIFGYQSRYGAFDEFILDPNDAPKIQEIVNYLNK